MTPHSRVMVDDECLNLIFMSILNAILINDYTFTDICSVLSASLFPIIVVDPQNKLDAHI